MPLIAVIGRKGGAADWLTPAAADLPPHHKHVPPDIKRNRVPAPGMSFTEPNLPTLLREIEEVFLSRTQEQG